MSSYRAFVADKDLEELASDVRHAAQFGEALGKAGLVAGVVVADQRALPVPSPSRKARQCSPEQPSVRTWATALRSSYRVPAYTHR